jgi:hypothetical protein
MGERILCLSGIFPEPLICSLKTAEIHGMREKK